MRSIVRKSGTNFLTFWGLLLERRVDYLTGREAITTMSYDSMMVMLTFGLLIVSLIGLIIVIIINMKK